MLCFALLSLHLKGQIIYFTLPVFYKILFISILLTHVRAATCAGVGAASIFTAPTGDVRQETREIVGGLAIGKYQGCGSGCRRGKCEGKKKKCKENGRKM